MQSGDKVRNRRSGKEGIVSHVDGANLYLQGLSPNVEHAVDWQVVKAPDADKSKWHE